LQRSVFDNAEERKDATPRRFVSTSAVRIASTRAPRPNHDALACRSSVPVDLGVPLIDKLL
jgi:hypothetical protein